MDKFYENVPNIISGKDLDYLSDMFSWNYGGYKSSANATEEVVDVEISEILGRAADVFYEGMERVLEIMDSEVENG